MPRAKRRTWRQRMLDVYPEARLVRMVHVPPGVNGWVCYSVRWGGRNYGEANTARYAWRAAADCLL